MRLRLSRELDKLITYIMCCYKICMRLRLSRELDKLITYIMCCYKTLYETSSVT